MGQWSGRNRAQAEASQHSHKRPHISDSAVQEVGGEEEEEEEVQGDEDVAGGCLAFGTCMRVRNRGREREGVFSSLLNLLPSNRSFCNVGPCNSYIPYILSCSFISLLTILGPGSAQSSKKRLTRDS